MAIKNGVRDTSEKSEKRSSMPLMSHESNLQEYINMIHETQSYETMKKNIIS